jgi:hypothetical protein
MRGQSFAANPLYAKRLLSHRTCVIEHGLCPPSSPYGLRRVSPDPWFLLALVALCFALSFTAPVQIAENAPAPRPRGLAPPPSLRLEAIYEFDWRVRANIWREVTSPARRPKQLRGRRSSTGSGAQFRAPGPKPPVADAERPTCLNFALFLLPATFSPL